MTGRLWDHHAHMDAPELWSERVEHLAQAHRSGVAGVLVPGFGPGRWDRSVSIAQERHSTGVAVAFGLHPWAVPPEVSRDPEAAVALLESGWNKYREQAPWSAIGEFGLDRSRRGARVALPVQEALFRSHLAIAQSAGLPVILHLVRSDGRALELLGAQALSAAGVVHSFGSHKETVPAYVKLGLYLSFSPTLLTSEKVRQALVATPTDRILFETDAPDGPRNAGLEASGPAALIEVINVASQVLGKSVEWCCRLHRENVRRLFRFGSQPTL